MRLVCGESKILTPWHCPRFLFLGLALQCNLLLTVGIQLQNFTIPEYAKLSQSAKFLCEFSLEDGEKLYSLQFYKDKDEFFRYVPSNNQAIVVFPTHGVKVERHQLGVNRVTLTLRDLNLNSTGVYKCEVSSESNFQTKFQERNLTVIIAPDPLNPRLSSFPLTVNMQDIVEGNCTSFRSRPAANLTFFINEGTRSNVTVYEPVSEIGRDGTQVWTSVARLRFRVTTSLFQKGTIRVKCVASVSGHESYESTKIITHNNHPRLSSYGQNQYSSGPPAFQARRGSWTFTIFCLFAYIIIWSPI